MRKKQPRDTSCRICGAGPFSARGEKAHRTRTQCGYEPSAIMPPPSPDLVNFPPHYITGKVECIDAIQSALTPEEFRGFCKGNALKYTWRELHKNGAEDIAKARWYLDRLGKDKL